jgi:phage shock protein C
MYRKLYRSNKDKKLGGVAGGLAEYFSVDPTLVRILFVLSVFLHGGGLLVYIILWIVVPEEPFVFVTPNAGTDEGIQGESGSSNTEDTNVNQNKYYQAAIEKQNKRTSILGAILIIIGVLFLMDNFIPRIHFGDFWPLIFVAVGIGLLLNARK